MRLAISTAGVLAGCVVLLGAGSAGAQDWPQWRGPNRNNQVTGFTAPKEWPKELAKKWKVTVGQGDSSPVLVGDKIYIFGRIGGDEVIQCLDAATGNELWKDKYAAAAPTAPAAGIHAGPRATPAVGEGKVCTFGVRGMVSCVDAASGKLAWRKETKGYPQFFTSASPLIADGKCIIFHGGSGAGKISAYDLASGDEKWTWSGESPSYGSPTLMTVDGVKQIATLTQSSLVGIGLEDGKQKWKVGFSAKYNNGTPIVTGDTVIISSPGAGTAAYKIEKTGDGFAAKELWKVKTAATTYNTPVLKDGLLFGLTSGGGKGAGAFFCMSARNGDVLWTDKTKRGDCGAVLAAGDVLLALTSDKDLVVFQPSDKGYMEVAKYRVAETPPWAYPIVSGNRIFVKDQNSMTLWTVN